MEQPLRGVPIFLAISAHILAPLLNDKLNKDKGSGYLFYILPPLPECAAWYSLHCRHLINLLDRMTEKLNVNGDLQRNFFEFRPSVPVILNTQLLGVT